MCNNPTKNGVVERKNRTLQEMARTMTKESNVEKYFWVEAINTFCYIINHVSIRKILNKTSYELWKNKKPNIVYFRIFGCYCYILNDKENLRKFDSKPNKEIFLGYATNSRGYRIFNLKNQTMETSMYVALMSLMMWLLTKRMKKKLLKKIIKNFPHKHLQKVGRPSLIILLNKSLDIHLMG